MNIGERIKEARKKAGLTQKELGNRLGVSAANISAFENNKTNIKPLTLKKIADALGCKASDITKQLVYRDEQDKGFYFYFFDNEEDEKCIPEKEMKFGPPEGAAPEWSEDDPMCIVYTSIPGNFVKLNNAGREEAIKRVEELTYIAKYILPDQEDK